MTQGSGSPSSIEVDLEANTPANKDTETEEARLLQLPRDDASNEAVAEEEVSPGESHSKRWCAMKQQTLPYCSQPHHVLQDCPLARNLCIRVSQFGYFLIIINNSP